MYRCIHCGNEFEEPIVVKISETWTQKHCPNCHLLNFVEIPKSQSRTRLEDRSISKK